MTPRTLMTEYGDIEVPGTLYKYRALSGEQRKFTANIILNRELWWSPASQLNDEWDCNSLARLSGSRLANELAMRRILRNEFPYLSKAEVKKIAKYRSRRPNHEFEAAMGALIEQERDSIGVCSLSSDPYVEKLWTDYADSHRGVCLRFDDLLIDERHGLSAQPHFGLAMRVSYQDERPGIQVYGKDIGYENLKKYLLTKTRKWEYEAEWRLVKSGFTGNRPFPPACLSGVIFGKAILDEDRCAVIDWVNARTTAVEFLQAREVDGKIVIFPDPLTTIC
jgi:hypothetical protein